MKKGGGFSTKKPFKFANKKLFDPKKDFQKFIPKKFNPLI